MKINIKNLVPWIPLLLLAIVVVAPDLVHAAVTAELKSATLSASDISAASTTNLCTIINNVRKWILQLAPILAIIGVIAGTAMWLTGGEKAGVMSWVRNITLKIVVGIFIIGIFYLIMSFLAIMIFGAPNVGDLVQCNDGLFGSGGKGILGVSLKEVTTENLLSTKADAGGIMTIVVNVKNFLIGLVGVISSVAVMVGLLQYIGAPGADAATKSRNMIVYAIGGVLIAWGANLIINIFLDLF